MFHLGPSDEDIDRVEEDLARLGARCRVAVKVDTPTSARGVWQHHTRQVTSFREALEIASAIPADARDVAVFVEHSTYGGMFVWSRTAPDVVNRFDHLPLR